MHNKLMENSIFMILDLLQDSFKLSIYKMLVIISYQVNI